MKTAVIAAEGDMGAARDRLDAWVQEGVGWRFDPATGGPLWLSWAEKAGWDPRTEVGGFYDLATVL